MVPLWYFCDVHPTARCHSLQALQAPRTRFKLINNRFVNTTGKEGDMSLSTIQSHNRTPSHGTGHCSLEIWCDCEHEQELTNSCVGGCCANDELCEYHVRRCKCLLHQTRGGIPTDESTERAGRVCVCLHQIVKDQEEEAGVKRYIYPYTSTAQLAHLRIASVLICVLISLYAQLHLSIG
jgi:hypothetical protein